MAEQNLENIVTNQLTVSSIGLPMIPTVVIGTVAMAMGQDLAADHTDNIHAIVAAGMGANVIIRNPIYFASHAFFNRKRLIKDRKIDWKRLTQDAASFFASSKIGYFVWAASCVGSSEYLLHQGYSPIEAGTTAGLVTGTAYAAYMSLITPRIDSVIKTSLNYGKRLKGKLFPRRASKL